MAQRPAASENDIITTLTYVILTNLRNGNGETAMAERQRNIGNHGLEKLN